MGCVGVRVVTIEDIAVEIVPGVVGIDLVLDCRLQRRAEPRAYASRIFAQPDIRPVRRVQVDAEVHVVSDLMYFAVDQEGLALFERGVRSARAPAPVAIRGAIPERSELPRIHTIRIDQREHIQDHLLPQGDRSRVATQYPVDHALERPRRLWLARVRAAGDDRMQFVGVVAVSILDPQMIDGPAARRSGQAPVGQFGDGAIRACPPSGDIIHDLAPGVGDIHRHIHAVLLHRGQGEREHPVGVRIDGRQPVPGFAVIRPHGAHIPVCGTPA